MMAAVWKPMPGKRDIVLLGHAPGVAHPEHLDDASLGPCIDAETIYDATGAPVCCVASYTNAKRTLFWVRPLSGGPEIWGQVTKDCTVTLDAPPPARAVLASQLAEIGLTALAARASVTEAVTRPTLVVANAPEQQPVVAGPPSKFRWGIDFVGMDVPPVEEFVRGFLAPGLTLLSATPKAGKTTLCHELALGVAGGTNALGAIPCKRACVLCLFLEDSQRRVIRRERELLGHGRSVPGIAYSFSGDRWTTGELERSLDANPQIRMVIIDTGQRYREANEGEVSSNIYKNDYAFFGSLQEMAIKRNIALIILHHDRKPNGPGKTNIIDAVSGTRAIAGSADHIWGLERDEDTNITKWSVVGRDLDAVTISYNRTADHRLIQTADAKTPAQESEEKRLKVLTLKAENPKLSYRKISDMSGASKSAVERWLREV